MKHLIKRSPKRIGIYTQRIVKPVFKARGLMEGKVITHWPQIVGERFAKIALAESITFPKGKKTEGTLHLSVTSSGALLLQYSQDLLLEQVNTFFGYKALTKLRMTHDFVPPKEVVKKIPVPLTDEEKRWVEDMTQDISDSDLRECLEKLGCSLMTSQQALS